MHLPVPGQKVGNLIGRGGANINAIRAATGARVKLHGGAPGSGERMLEIVGSADQIGRAQRMVVEFLQD